MALIREATVLLRGKVRHVEFAPAKAGGEYATVRVENEGGISDVSISPDIVAKLNVHAMKLDTPVSWIVRPYVKSGTSRAGNVYAFMTYIYQAQTE